MSEYSQGVCQDGAAILKDGQMMTIEEILAALNNHERLVEALRDLRSSAAAAHECRYLHSGGDLNQALARQEIAERKADELLAALEAEKGGEL